MNQTDKSERFIQHLGRLDRGALAVLRRGIRKVPGADGGSIALVEPFVASTAREAAEGRVRDAERSAYYLVAGLYALKERAASAPGRIRGDLGASIGRLYRDRDRAPSIEHRFVNLLDADPDQLPYRLRQMVSLLAADGVPVNWARLVTDLTFWGAEGRPVQQRWARSFYGSGSPDDRADAPATDVVPSPLTTSDERKPS